MSTKRLSSKPPTRKRKALETPDGEGLVTPAAQDTTMTPETMSLDIKARIAFFHLYANWPQIHAASIMGVDAESIYSFVARAKPNKQETLTDGELEDITRIKKVVRAAAKDMPGGAMSRPVRRWKEVMRFPGKNESVEHAQHLVAHSDAVRHSLSIAMYVMTHVGIVQAIISARDRIQALNPGTTQPAVWVILDHQQLKSPGSQIYKLLVKGIEVKVSEKSTFMMHSKYALFDSCKVAHGSVNWTDHALVSQGHCVIEKDQELYDLFLADFDSMWDSRSRGFRAVTQGFLERLDPPLCSQCQAKLKEQKQNAREAAEAEKQAEKKARQAVKEAEKAEKQAAKEAAHTKKQAKKTGR